MELQIDQINKYKTHSVRYINYTVNMIYNNIYYRYINKNPYLYNCYHIPSVRSCDNETCHYYIKTSSSFFEKVHILNKNLIVKYDQMMIK